jgi:hypothetical protein
MFQTKVVERIRTHIFCSITFFFPTIVPFMRQWGKIQYSGAGHRWQYGTRTLHAGYLRLQTDTVTMVARLHLNIMLYVRCLSFIVIFLLLERCHFKFSCHLFTELLKTFAVIHTKHVFLISLVSIEIVVLLSSFDVICSRHDFSSEHVCFPIGHTQKHLLMTAMYYHNAFIFTQYAMIGWCILFVGMGLM